MGTAMEKYLYFRTVADEDDDDAAADTLALPARRIVAMAPSADTTITVWFESVNNMQTDGANELVLKDSAVITVTAHRHKKVLQEITKKSYSNGHHSLSPFLYKWDGRRFVRFMMTDEKAMWN